MANFTVAIAGGGASGTLAAAAIVRSAPGAHAVIIEPREQLGRGIAYSTDCPLHVLNVPAAKISAYPDQPDHFVRWLGEHSAEPYMPSSFVPRSIYGDYLAMQASDAQTQATSRWRHVRALATGARPEGDGIRVTCSNGEIIDADALVVASGNAAPAEWPQVSAEAKGSTRFFGSAWAAGAIVPGDLDETVLLLGTGLTAVDAVLGLRYNGHRGTIYMVSRRGLLPHEHRVFDTPPTAHPEADTVAGLLEAVRKLTRESQSGDVNWRHSIDSVRPKTNALWQALSLAEQRRFLRHALPYWNVHRHRMAPEAAKAIAELIAADGLRTLAGRTGEITAEDRSLCVPVKLRGSGKTMMLRAGRVINCSGPEHDFRKLSNPLIASLLAQGLMVPYPLNIGVQVAPDGALIDAGGQASKRLFAIGPARYGTLIETTAIPEIRAQARDLAALLAGNAASGSSIAGTG